MHKCSDTSAPLEARESKVALSVKRSNGTFNDDINYDEDCALILHYNQHTRNLISSYQALKYFGSETLTYIINNTIACNSMQNFFSKLT